MKKAHRALALPAHFARPLPPGGGGALARQGGAVLLIALIVLIAMTLSALALIRSVNMTNLIAGNFAFRESAVLSSERAAESAIVWLIGKSRDSSGKATDTLHSNDLNNGYLASLQDPLAGQDWSDYFRSNTLNVKPVSVGGTDAAGNTVAYVIHRLCDKAGTPINAAGGGVAFCSRAPAEGSGGSQLAGGVVIGAGGQIYYRITSRVTGPRNTIVYTQTIIAI